MKKINIFFLYFFILSFSQSIAEIPSPNQKSFFDIKTIISQFRRPLRRKIKDLHDNFITKVSNNTIYYSSHIETNCNRKKFSPRSTISYIKIVTKKEKNIIKDQISYYGCRGTLALREEITTKGYNNPIGTTLKDLLKGELSFKLSKNITSKSYRLLDSERTEIFRFYSQRKKEKTNYKFYFFQQLFLTKHFSQNIQKSEYQFLIRGVSQYYKKKFRSWGINTNQKEENFKITIRKNKSPEYLQYGEGLISESTFQNEFNEKIFNSIFLILLEIVEYHLNFFPKTDAPKNIATEGRILEELRLAFIRLTNNKELNLVKLLVQEYIEAIENGLLLFEGKRSEKEK